MRDIEAAVATRRRVEKCHVMAERRRPLLVMLGSHPYVWLRLLGHHRSPRGFSQMWCGRLAGASRTSDSHTEPSTGQFVF